MTGYYTVPWAAWSMATEPWEMAAVGVVYSAVNAGRGEPVELSRGYLAGRVGCSPSQARGFLSRLVSAGLIDELPGSRTSPSRFMCARAKLTPSERQADAKLDSVSTEIKDTISPSERQADAKLAPHREDYKLKLNSYEIINSRAREEGVEPSPVMGGYELLSVARELVEGASDLGVAPMLSSADSQALQTWARRGTITGDDLRLVWEWLTTSHEWEPVRCREGWLSWGQIANKNLERRIASARQWERRGKVDNLPTRRDQKPSMTEKERIEWEEWCADIPEILEKQRRNRR